MEIRGNVGRIRTIKPEFSKHAGLFDLEKETGLPIRVAFAGLWTCCDREGRFKWRPRELKLDVLPYDDCDFSRVLDALATRAFVVKYEAGREEYGFIPSWHKHQIINTRESASILPEPPKNKPHKSHVEHASGTRRTGKGKEGKGNILLEIYEAYPKHVAKTAALEAISKALQKISPDHDGAWLLERVKAYAEQRRGEDAQYTPYPATWFNRGSYEDDSLTPKPKTEFVMMDGSPLPGRLI